MNEPRFLTVEDVIGIHWLIISDFGGSPGILNRSLLESAVASQSASFDGQFLNDFPFEMAAALLVGLAQNHGFRDGNKRTASMACLSFLEINEVRVDLNDGILEHLVMGVATKMKTKRDVALILRQHRKTGK